MRKEELIARKDAQEQSLQDLAKQTLEAKQRIVQEYVQEEAQQYGSKRGGRDDGSSKSSEDEDDQRAVKRERPDEDEDEDARAARLERDRIREDRRRERERQRRLENAKGKRPKGDEERDVSERIALGERVPMSRDAMFDQRLFNRADAGGPSITSGGDDEYNIYDKPLFNAGSGAALYKAPTATDAEYISDADMKKLTDTSKFRPAKDFSGVDRSAPSQPRSEPVQFERGSAIGGQNTKAAAAAPAQEKSSGKEEEGDLLADFDDFLKSAKTAKK